MNYDLDHGEGIQIWHYGVNDSYGPHYDFYESSEAKLGGNRVATVVMYLSNVTSGGETVFPKSQVKMSFGTFMLIYKKNNPIYDTGCCFFVVFCKCFCHIYNLLGLSNNDIFFSFFRQQN
jgi:2OG-Fe(II) oxygenase superfamily